MADMPHWNAFVREVLKGKQDKPDKGDKGNLSANFLDTKKAEKRGVSFERNGNK